MIERLKRVKRHSLIFARLDDAATGPHNGQLHGLFDRFVICRCQVASDRLCGHPAGCIDRLELCAVIKRFFERRGHVLNVRRHLWCIVGQRIDCFGFNVLHEANKVWLHVPDSRRFKALIPHKPDHASKRIHKICRRVGICTIRFFEVWQRFFVGLFIKDKPAVHPVHIWTKQRVERLDGLLQAFLQVGFGIRQALSSTSFLSGLVILNK